MGWVYSTGDTAGHDTGNCWTWQIPVQTPDKSHRWCHKGQLGFAGGWDGGPRSGRRDNKNNRRYTSLSHSWNQDNNRTCCSHQSMSQTCHHSQVSQGHRCFSPCWPTWGPRRWMDAARQCHPVSAYTRPDGIGSHPPPSRSDEVWPCPLACARERTSARAGQFCACVLTLVALNNIHWNLNTAYGVSEMASCRAFLTTVLSVSGSAVLLLSSSFAEELRTTANVTIMF